MLYYVHSLAHDLIDSVYAQGEMNVLDQFAAPFPAEIVSEILGLPETDVPRFTGWVSQLSRALSASFTREEVPEIDAAAGHLTAYVGELL